METFYPITDIFVCPLWPSPIAGKARVVTPRLPDRVTQRGTRRLGIFSGNDDSRF